MRGMFILCLTFFIIVGGVYAQSSIAMLDEDLISGKGIRGITEWNHSFSGEKPAENGNISLRARYNNKGYQLEEVTFNSKGEESRRVTSRFDNMGNRTEHRVTDLRNNRLTFSQMAGYDQAGNKVAEWGFDGLGDYRNIFHLKPDGRIDRIEYTTQGNLKETRIFAYSGNETEVTVMLPDGSISETIRLKHNSLGYLVIEANYDNKDNQVRKVEYSYNNKGMKTGERRYHGDQMQYRDVYLYDGDLLSEIVRTGRQGRQNTTNKYSYDGKGQLIKEEWYNENTDNYSTREYSWDNNRNMVSVECFYATYEFRVMYRYDYSFF